MSESAHVGYLETLSDLKKALNRFGQRIPPALTTTHNEIKRTQALLQQRQLHWQRQMQNAQRHLQQAQAALGRCRRQNRTAGRGRSCTGEERAVGAARQRLREAETKLRQVRKSQSRLETAINQYQRHANRLQSLANSHTPRACAFLDRALADLERYLSTETPSTGGSAFTPMKQTAVSLPNRSENVSSTINLASDQSDKTWVEPSRQNVKASGQSGKTWVERGIQNVKVSDLPDPKDITSKEDFHKVSLEDMQSGLERLPEMLPLIESGEGNSRDYWATVDEQRGLSIANGYQRVYDAFYGESNVIRLNRDGNQYSIINGRHRIWLAKRMGIETLPASIAELQ